MLLVLTLLIQDAFKDEDGKFNDVAFTNYYNSVQQMFNDAENTSWEQAMLNSYEYDKLDPLAPINAKRRDMSPALVDIQNPERRAWGLVHLAKAGNPTASAREVGQQNKVFNLLIFYTLPALHSWTDFNYRVGELSRMGFASC